MRKAGSWTSLLLLLSCSRVPDNAADAESTFVDCMASHGLDVSEVSITKSDFDYQIGSSDLPGKEIGKAAHECEQLAQAVLDGENASGTGLDSFDKSTHQIKMRDGIKLATDVYLPAGTGPFPVVLYRTPYEKQNDAPALANAYLENGLAVAIQDLRGRGESEGEDRLFTTDGPGELSDGADTIAWLKKQSFCSGLIVSDGISASGIASYMQMAAQPPGLVGGRVDVATANLYDSILRGGVFRESLTEGWLRNQGSLHFMDDIYAHPYKDEFWSSVQTRSDYSRVNVPVLHVGGWYDVFLQDTLDAFVGFQSEGGKDARGQQRLVIGPWEHGVWRESTRVGQLTYPDNSLHPAATPEELWWGLLSEVLGLELPENQASLWSDAPVVQYFVMGDPEDENAPGNEWRSASSWPPEMPRKTLYLTDEGTLADEPRGTSSSYRSDPEDPSPTICGANLNIDSGPCDQREIEERSDGLVFETELFDVPVEVTGQLNAHFSVELDQPDADLTVRLSDVYPDGRSMLVTEGAARIAARKGTNGLDLVSNGELVEVDIDLLSTSLIFNKGHRLRISVTSSNYPRYRVNHNNGLELSADRGEPRLVEITIHHSKQAPSFLELPMAQAEDS